MKSFGVSKSTFLRFAFIIFGFLASSCVRVNDDLSKSAASATNAKVSVVGSGSSGELLDITIYSSAAQTIDLGASDQFKGVKIAIQEGTCDKCRIIITKLTSASLSESGRVDYLKYQVIGEIKKDLSFLLPVKILIAKLFTTTSVAEFSHVLYYRSDETSAQDSSVTSTQESVELTVPQRLITAYVGLGRSAIAVEQPVVSYSTSNDIRMYATETVEPTQWTNISNASIEPALPSGLSFDGATGRVSGKLSQFMIETEYTVTAANASGLSTTAKFKIKSVTWYPKLSPTLAGVTREIYPWFDSASDATVFVITPAETVPVEISGSTTITFECSSTAVYGGTAVSWVACDGATGASLVAKVVQDSAYPNGQYNLQVRAKGNGGTSNVSPVYSFYMHARLDNRDYCTTYQNISDDEVFAAAGSFALLASVHRFGSATQLSTPRNIIQWSTGNIGEIRRVSLKLTRKDVNGTDLILARRTYQRGGCSINSPTGRGIVTNPAGDFIVGFAEESCAAVVFNADGYAWCAQPTGGLDNVQTPKRINFTRKMGLPYNISGTIDYTHGDYRDSSTSRSTWDRSLGSNLYLLKTEFDDCVAQGGVGYMNAEDASCSNYTASQLVIPE